MHYRHAQRISDSLKRRYGTHDDSALLAAWDLMDRAANLDNAHTEGAPDNVISARHKLYQAALSYAQAMLK